MTLSLSQLPLNNLLRKTRKNIITERRKMMMDLDLNFTLMMKSVTQLKVSLMRSTASSSSS